MDYAHCMLDTWVYKQTLRICNTYSYSTASEAHERDSLLKFTGKLLVLLTSNNWLILFFLPSTSICTRTNLVKLKMEALLPSEKLERRKHSSHRHSINDEKSWGRSQGTLTNMTWGKVPWVCQIFYYVQRRPLSRSASQSSQDHREARRLLQCS
jgi:hypothetical protein